MARAEAQRRIKAEEEMMQAKLKEAALSAAHNEGKDSKKASGLSSSMFDVKNGVQSSVRNIIRASNSALELEKRRQQIYEELSTKNKALKESTGQIQIKFSEEIDV